MKTDKKSKQEYRDDKDTWTDKDKPEPPDPDEEVEQKIKNLMTREKKSKQEKMKKKEKVTDKEKLMRKIKKARKERWGETLIKATECLDKVDNDVADLCIAILPDKDRLISMSDVMYGIQDIKNKLIKTIRRDYIPIKKKDAFTEIKNREGLSSMTSPLTLEGVEDSHAWRMAKLEQSHRQDISKLKEIIKFLCDKIEIEINEKDFQKIREEVKKNEKGN